MYTPIPIEVHRLDASTEVVTVCPAEPGAPFCIIDEVVCDAVLSSYDQGGWWIAIAGPDDERSRPLIDLPDSDDTNARSDGTDLVWLRGLGPIVAGRPSRIELWASPYAELPEGITPRRVARVNVLGLVNTIGVGNGRAWAFDLVDLTSYDAYYASIYDLASGERRVYRAPATERAGEPMLGRDEFAVAIHPAPPGNFRETRTVRFISYDSLPVEPPLD